MSLDPSDPQYNLQNVRVKWTDISRLQGYFGGLYFEEGLSEPIQRFMAEQFILSAGDRFIIEEIPFEKPKQEPAVIKQAAPIAPFVPLPTPKNRDEALTVLGMTLKSRDEEIKAKYELLIKQYPSDAYPAQYVQLVDAYRMIFVPVRHASVGVSQIPSPVKRVVDDSDHALKQEPSQMLDQTLDQVQVPKLHIPSPKSPKQKSA